MVIKHRLNPDERDFFSLVHQAVLANPFSDERIDIDLKIAGLFPNVSREELIEKTISEVSERINRIKKQNKEDLKNYVENDQIILRTSFLFDFFHHFIQEFDQLILDQIKSADEPVPIEFSKEAFSYLRNRGFQQDERLHFFALCYQLRRAYYFIDRNLIGRSACMKNLRESLWNNVFTYDLDLYNRYMWNRMEDFSTLILGETGTGKGTAAMAIGRSGYIPFNEKRKCFAESFMQSFIPLNLSQFSESLIESELFGHKKGAFTGAIDAHKGVFDRCSPYGAILLDEIGEVSVPVQIKLLKVLEERAYTAVGSHEERRFEGRIIAATNRSLDEIRNHGVMRDDFYYRLSSDIIIVPPLRQRIQEDPMELVDLLQNNIQRIIGTPSKELSESVKKTIKKQLGPEYLWPGNVRELAQCVRRILLNRNYSTIQETIVSDSCSQLAGQIEDGNIDAQGLLKTYCTLLYERFGTYGEVARRTKLDRRTVKKYIDVKDKAELVTTA